MAARSTRTRYKYDTIKCYLQLLVILEQHCNKIVIHAHYDSKKPQIENLK